MASVPLTRDQHRRLVRLLAERAGILTSLQRENLLERAGLYRVVLDLNMAAPARDFAPQLVRVLQERVGTLEETGQPALVSLLRELHELVAGHEAEAAFLDELLAPYIAEPSSPAPTNSPSLPSATSPPPPPPQPPDAAVERCLEEAGRAAQQQLYRFLGLSALVFLPIAIALVVWWTVLEPVTYVLGVVLVLLGAAFYARTGQAPSVEWLRTWLERREQARRGCAERSAGTTSVGGGGATGALSPPVERSGGGTQGDQRAAEIAYLKRRRDLEVFDPADVFTTLEGSSRPTMRHRFTHRPEFRDAPAEPHAAEAHEFEDIVAEVGRIRRAVLLGEPGSGKTTTLRKVEVGAIRRALGDERAPIPLFVPLKEWQDAAQPLWAFVGSQAGVLAPYLDKLVEEKRLQLLLDGLDQVPPEKRADKALEIKAWLGDYPELPALVSCRVLDYGRIALGVDRIEIAPLSPSRIREYIHNYLTAGGQAEVLFWQIAGGTAVRDVWRVWERAGATLDQFWASDRIPRESPNVWDATSGVQDTVWREQVRVPGTLMALACNPYMLLMLVDVYEAEGTLPRNRGDLFARFVRRLLAREGLTSRDPLTEEVQLTPEGSALRKALAQLAFGMLRARSERGEEGAVVSLAEAEVVPQYLTPGQLQRARSATLLAAGDPVSFSHQLLQEYFAATQMESERAAGRLTARDLWPPERWWERSGWEEATILLAGLHSDDCTPVLDWVQAANPEVAAQCIKRSGAHTPKETLKRLRAVWLPRLTDLEGDPHPYGQAAVGRALAIAELDNRSGVGVRADGVPKFDWVPIDGGEFIYQDGETREVDGFSISRYPVTNWQWEAFLSAEDGYQNGRWWEGLAGGKQEPVEPRWNYGNHPRETVNWYEAIAFCRWLTARLGLDEKVEVVRLPTEEEWERAARGREGRAYPWGEEYESGRANINETFGDVGPYYLPQTSAVEIYPQGATPDGIQDLSGNVWEWTLAQYESGKVDITSSAARVLRGGSWDFYHGHARAASRYGSAPRGRLTSATVFGWFWRPLSALNSEALPSDLWASDL